MTNSPATSLRRYDWGEGGAATLLTTVHHAPTYTDLVWHSDSSTDFGKAGIMARKYSSRNGILPFCEGADQSVSTTTVRVPCRGGEAGEGFESDGIPFLLSPFIPSSNTLTPALGLAVDDAFLFPPLHTRPAAVIPTPSAGTSYGRTANQCGSHLNLFCNCGLPARLNTHRRRRACAARTPLEHRV